MSQETPTPLEAAASAPAQIKPGDRICCAKSSKRYCSRSRFFWWSTPPPAGSGSKAKAWSLICTTASSVIDKISYLLHSPERGDVVVFTPPNNERDYIKRVIGLPGDTVEVKGGQVYVNGVVLDEPYLKNR